MVKVSRSECISLGEEEIRFEGQEEFRKHVARVHTLRRRGVNKGGGMAIIEANAHKCDMKQITGASCWGI